VTAGGFRIKVVHEYRGSFVFVVSSGESDHFIVSRLYLTYLGEFKWKPKQPDAEAFNIRAAYFIPLSRDYSEYDLLPQTKDNSSHGYEYKGGDSDSFAVSCSGFEVAKVQVCATVLDVKRGETYLIKSEEIDMVRSQDMYPIWRGPLQVKEGRFVDQFEPLLYKALTHKDYRGFVDSLDLSLLKRLKNQINTALSRTDIEKLHCVERLKELNECVDRMDDN
jgi:hypothetical protein